MNIENEKVAGVFLFLGTLQAGFVQLILALVEPVYSFQIEFISELGAPGAANALIFNVSVLGWGICMLIAALLLYRASAGESMFPNRLFAIMIILMGIAGIGAGLAPMHTYPSIYPLPLHSIFGYVFNIFLLIAIFLSLKIMKPPLSYIQLVLGVLAVLTTILFVTATDLGLGWGGMERVYFVVVFAWLYVTSTYLMSKS
ncbi:MAG: DUF998 domain-containing protein [Promethearchaeota archaeon]